MEQQSKNVSMTAQLTNKFLKMEVGRQLAFPVERLNVVRTTASNLGISLGRRYITHTDRENRTVTVTRTE